MFQDPLSPHTLPPARYTLESDSEDEEGQGAYAGVKSVQPQTASARVRVSSELMEPVQRLIVAIGEAADYMGQLADGEDAGRVEINGKTSGSLFELGSGQLLVLFEQELPLEVCHSVAQELMSAFPTPTLAITTYSPPSYISLQAGETRGYAPIRAISTSGVQLGEVEPYKNPNYVSGLAASLLSLAAHPSRRTSLSVLLLPLQLATLAPADVIAAVIPFATQLNGKNLSHWKLKSHSTQRPRVTEDSQSMYV